ncbi:universal stress protein [Halobaculum limi]|uniref:universal stress protein n=1 Tax=Halobaculum limi TaxID=3031916 RepID=UPI0024051C90|nr:universal stress protein [Halobaculum sp. YSMS11]
MAHISGLTILVPFDVSETEPPALDVLDALGDVEVVLLGYFPVPDQAEPALIRDQYGPEAADRLDAVAADHGTPDHVLVFTHDREASIDRVAEEYDCDAVLTAGRSTTVERVLVPLRGDVNLDRILGAVAGLLLAGDEAVTLFHAVAADTDPSQGELLLAGAVDRLVEYGVDRGRIDSRVTEDSDAQTGIVDLAAAYDLVVLGETEPSLRERVIGDRLSAIIDALDVPALVVRDVE